MWDKTLQNKILNNNYYNIIIPFNCTIPFRQNAKIWLTIIAISYLTISRCADGDRSSENYNKILAGINLNTANLNM